MLTHLVKSMADCKFTNNLSIVIEYLSSPYSIDSATGNINIAQGIVETITITARVKQVKVPDIINYPVGKDLGVIAVAGRLTNPKRFNFGDKLNCSMIAEFFTYKGKFIYQPVFPPSFSQNQEFSSFFGDRLFGLILLEHF